MRTLVAVVLLAAIALPQDQTKAKQILQFGYVKLKTDPKGALEDFAKAIEADPESPFGYFASGHAHMKLHAWEAAIASYGKAVERGFVQARLPRALAREVVQDYEGALEDYARVVAWRASYLNALVHRARLHERMGNAKEMAADCRTHLEKVDADAARPWVKLAFAKAKLGDLAGAAEDLQVAIHCDAREPTAYLVRGYVRLLEGKEKEAAADFDKAVEVAPDSGDGWFGRGRLRMDRGQLDEARADFEKTISLDPRIEEAPLYLFLVQVRLGDREKAAARLKQWLETHEDHYGWFTRTCAEFLVGRMSEEQLFEAARTENKHAARERECLAFYYAGAMRLAAGDAEKGKAYLERCVATELTMIPQYESAEAALR